MTDIIQQNNRERITSDDINNRQDIVSRQLAEYLRNAFAYRTMVGSVSSELPRDVVFGGYDFAEVGTDLVFGAGAMGILSATLPAVPRTYESSYRYLLNTDPQSVSFVGVPDGWALVLATPVQVDTLVASRDIWDPGAGAFVSTPGQVKTRVQRAALSLISTGTATNIPVWTAAQTVLWAVRFAAGVVAERVDLRNLVDTLAPGDDSGTVSRRGLRMESRTACRFDLAASLFGVALSHRSLDDVSLQTYAANGVTITNSTTYYLYLAVGAAADGSLCPRGYYADSAGRGLFVVSPVAPDPDTLLNSGSITPGAPFASHVLAAGRALCVGAVRTGTSSDQINDSQECSLSGLHTVSIGGGGGGKFLIVLSSASAAADLTGAGGGPIGVRSVRAKLSSTSGSTVAFTSVTLAVITTAEQIATFGFAADHAAIYSDVDLVYSFGRSFVRIAGTWTNNTYCQLQSYQW